MFCVYAAENTDHGIERDIWDSAKHEQTALELMKKLLSQNKTQFSVDGVWMELWFCSPFTEEDEDGLIHTKYHRVELMQKAYP